LVFYCKYFKPFRNFLVKSKYFKTRYNMVNLIEFLYKNNVILTDPILEFKIAKFFKCSQYKTFIKNYLKCYDLPKYYSLHI